MLTNVFTLKIDLCNIFAWPLVCKIQLKISIHVSGADEAAEKLAKCAIIEPTFTSPPPQSNNAPSTQSDPAKRLKNLRKKLREIETLEEKLKSGVLKTLDKEQKDKISKKTDILNEIDTLENSSK